MSSTARAWLAALTAEFGAEGTLHVPHETVTSGPDPAPGDDGEQTSPIDELRARVTEYNARRRMFEDL
ncbi:hypothetical protein [Streptomyces sp. NPDC048442]|uniref:hypothetical protein n=1 Tax=Streptomyces sp. NPDC048442 TaxID=3154823 RepID=UPI003436BEAF